MSPLDAQDEKRGIQESSLSHWRRPERDRRVFATQKIGGGTNLFHFRMHGRETAIKGRTRNSNSSLGDMETVYCAKNGNYIAPKMVIVNSTKNGKLI